MTNQPLTLRDIAQAASDRHNGARGRELDRIAKSRGLTLSYTTVDKILNGIYTSRPKRSTLDALAQLAGIPQEKAYEAAGMPLPQTRLQDQLPPDIDELRPDQRKMLIDLARGLLQQNRREQELLRRLAQLEERGGNAVSTAPITHAGESPATDPERRERSTLHSLLDEASTSSRDTENAEDGGTEGDELARRRRAREAGQEEIPLPDEDLLAGYDEPQESILAREQQDADAEGSQD
ncbi:hypothetical protein [Kocuria sp. KH4]